MFFCFFLRVHSRVFLKFVRFDGEVEWSGVEWRGRLIEGKEGRREEGI